MNCGLGRGAVWVLAAWILGLVLGRPALAGGGLAISELMYNPAGGDAYEFIELQNYGDAPVDLSGMNFSGVSFQFPANSVLAPGGIVVLISNENPAAFANRYPGVSVAGMFTKHLSNGGEAIRLHDRTGRVLIWVEYSDGGFWPRLADGGGHSLELANHEGEMSDPANWRASLNVHGTPGQKRTGGVAEIHLNEIAAEAPDGRGALQSGWIELHNPTDREVNIGGWSFSQLPGVPREFVIPEATMIGPGKYLMFWRALPMGAAGIETGMRLSPRGATLFLYDERTNTVDAVSFGQLAEGYTVGRFEDEWHLAGPSPAGKNQRGVMGPVEALLINEWQAASQEGDWLEVFNRDETRPVELAGLTVMHGEEVFVIRGLIGVPPRGFVQLWADERVGVDHLGFRLSATGGSISLYDSKQTRIDRVEYGVQLEGTTQGRHPDGAERLLFFGSGGTPGASNVTDADGDGLPNEWEARFGLDPGNGADGVLDADADGMSNLDEYTLGSDPRDSRSVLRMRVAYEAELLRFEFEALAGRGYSIVWSSNLERGSWRAEIDVPAGEARTVKVTNRVDWGMAPRFYRLVTPRWVDGPVVRTTSPLGGQTHVAASAVVKVVFREPIDLGQPGENLVTVRDDLGRRVQGRVRFGADASELEFSPDLPLAHDTRYAVTIADGILSQSNEQLGSAAAWEFQTGPSSPLREDAGIYAQDSVDVVNVRIQPFILPGGVTMADVDKDVDPNDMVRPRVNVLFEEGAFGSGWAVPNGTIQQRGQSSRETDQKSYRVDLYNSVDAWRGHRVIHLNKHPYDLTRIRNKLSFDLFQGTPHLTSLRTLFVHLVIGETDFGLFTQVENPDSTFLTARGLDGGGQLYKAKFFEFLRYPGHLRSRSDPNYDEVLFESILEIKGNRNHEKLLAMLADVNDEQVPIDRVIAKHFNRDNYLTWLAVNVLTGNLDTSSQNFYLYSPTAASCWYFLPWDYDGSWGFFSQPDQAPVARARWRQGVANWWGVTLHRRFLRVEANVAALSERIGELEGTVFKPERVDGLVSAYRPRVEPFALRQPDRQFLPVAGDDLAGELDAEFRRLKGIAATNQVEFARSLDRPMPVFLGNPEAVGDGWRFRWSASYHLKGEPFSYDFALSRNVTFSDLVMEEPGLDVTQKVVTAALAKGVYYWRVIIRSRGNPAVDWQFPFDTYHDPDSGVSHYGMKRFEVP